MQDAQAAAPEHRWQPLGLQEVKQLLAGASARWWIAGGQSLDMFIGHETRKHNDIDVAVLRRDQQMFREALASWDVHIAHDGAFIPWRRGETITNADHHEIWARETPDGPWRLELLFEESDAERWKYRRDPHIGLNLADLGRRDAYGIEFIRPEVTLLYKSKTPRPVDETDFLYALPRLDVAQKAWLSGALFTVDPRHRWLSRLK